MIANTDLQRDAQLKCNAKGHFMEWRTETEAACIDCDLYVIVRPQKGTFSGSAVKTMCDMGEAKHQQGEALDTV